MADALVPTPSADPDGPADSWTFAVIGDSRGDSDGNQPAVFRDIVREVGLAAPELVLNVGDMINGYAGDGEPQLRRMWLGYHEVISELGAPVHHAPGNHDLFDATSASVWASLWGPTYRRFDHRRVRFLALDTESSPNRLGPAQWDWLRHELGQLGDRRVIVFLHRPLFPVDGHRGASLDAYPWERDALHALFVAHRQAIAAVFQGHEHLYHAESRDGVRYYIVGGGGEELYAPPELGGFFHFLIVRVSPAGIDVEVREVGRPAETVEPPRRISPGTVLEEWPSGLHWSAWNRTVATTLVRSGDAGRRSGLKVSFDFSRCEWPMLILAGPPRWDWSRLEALRYEVYVPETSGESLSIVLLAETPSGSSETKPVELHPGWNSVRVEMTEGWIPQRPKSEITSLQWIMVARQMKPAGSVIFGGIWSEVGGQTCGAAETVGGQSRDALESWDGSLLWGVWDNTVSAGPPCGFGTKAPRGLELTFDPAQCPDPVLYASLMPRWDLEAITAVCLQIDVPDGSAEGLAIQIVLATRDQKCLGPACRLQPGSQSARFDLRGGWLSPRVRSGAAQIEWRILTGDVRSRRSFVLRCLTAE